MDLTPTSSPTKLQLNDVPFDLGAKGALSKFSFSTSALALDHGGGSIVGSSPHSISAYAPRRRDRDAEWVESGGESESEEADGAWVGKLSGIRSLKADLGLLPAGSGFTSVRSLSVELLPSDRPPPEPQLPASTPPAEESDESDEGRTPPPNPIEPSAVSPHRRSSTLRPMEGDAMARATDSASASLLVPEQNECSIHKVPTSPPTSTASISTPPTALVASLHQQNELAPVPLPALGTIIPPSTPDRPSTSHPHPALSPSHTHITPTLPSPGFPRFTPSPYGSEGGFARFGAFSHSTVGSGSNGITALVDYVQRDVLGTGETTPVRSSNPSGVRREALPVMREEEEFGTDGAAKGSPMRSRSTAQASPTTSPVRPVALSPSPVEAVAAAPIDVDGSRFRTPEPPAVSHTAVAPVTLGSELPLTLEEQDIAEEAIAPSSTIEDFMLNLSQFAPDVEAPEPEPQLNVPEAADEPEIPESATDQGEAEVGEDLALIEARSVVDLSMSPIEALAVLLGMDPAEMAAPQDTEEAEVADEMDASCEEQVVEEQEAEPEAEQAEVLLETAFAASEVEEEEEAEAEEPSAEPEELAQVAASLQTQASDEVAEEVVVDRSPTNNSSAQLASSPTTQPSSPIVDTNRSRKTASPQPRSVSIGPTEKDTLASSPTSTRPAAPTSSATRPTHGRPIISPRKPSSFYNTIRPAAPPILPAPTTPQGPPRNVPAFLQSAPALIDSNSTSLAALNARVARSSSVAASSQSSVSQAGKKGRRSLFVCVEIPVKKSSITPRTTPRLSTEQAPSPAPPSVQAEKAEPVQPESSEERATRGKRSSTRSIKSGPSPDAIDLNRNEPPAQVQLPPSTPPRAAPAHSSTDSSPPPFAKNRSALKSKSNELGRMESWSKLEPVLPIVSRPPTPPLATDSLVTGSSSQLELAARHRRTPKRIEEPAETMIPSEQPTLPLSPAKKRTEVEEEEEDPRSPKKPRRRPAKHSLSAREGSEPTLRERRNSSQAVNEWIDDTAHMVEDHEQVEVQPTTVDEVHQEAEAELPLTPDVVNQKRPVGLFFPADTEDEDDHVEGEAHDSPRPTVDQSDSDDTRGAPQGAVDAVHTPDEGSESEDEFFSPAADVSADYGGGEEEQDSVEEVKARQEGSTREEKEEDQPDGEEQELEHEHVSPSDGVEESSSAPEKSAEESEEFTPRRRSRAKLARRQSAPVKRTSTPLSSQPKRRGRPPGSSSKKKVAPSSAVRAPAGPNRRHTISPTLSRTVGGAEAPASTGRPQRNRKSAANWWDIGQALEGIEELKKKRGRQDSNEPRLQEEEEAPPRPKRGRPRVIESDEDGDDEGDLDPSPELNTSRGRPRSSLTKKKTSSRSSLSGAKRGRGRSKAHVRVVTPSEEEEEEPNPPLPSPSPSPPLPLPTPETKKVIQKAPRTRPTLLGRARGGPSWAEGAGWEGLREVGGLDVFSD